MKPGSKSTMTLITFVLLAFALPALGQYVPAGSSGQLEGEAESD